MRKTRWVADMLFLLLVLGTTDAHAETSNTFEPVISQTVVTADGSSMDSELMRRIGFIDFYGVHRLDAKTLRNQLTFNVGDLIRIGDRSFFRPSQQQLLKISGVARAHVDVICCSDGLPAVFVGIEEIHAPVMRFRRTPTGSIALPPEVLQAGAKFNLFLQKAAMSGNADEDDSEGSQLLVDPAARPAEDRLIHIANDQRELIRQVLRNSADPDHRALAAQLLGYSKEKQSVVPDLIYAMSDCSPNVRNNAMRALVVFKAATKIKPPHVPYKPFIALLNSPDWTDRNKSSAAIFEMASTRNPALLKMLREEALPSLIEMAQWSDRGHAFFPFWILGYVGGLDEKIIASDWERNDRNRVIASAIGS